MLCRIVINIVFENIQIIIKGIHVAITCALKIKAEFVIVLAFINSCKHFCFALKKNLFGRS